MSASLPNISIIIPCYNEEAIVRENLIKIHDFLTGFKNEFSWEILIINDGSFDNTGDIAEETANQLGRIRVIHHHSNLNLGNALKTGFANAKGDYIVTYDLDMSYSMSHIPELVDEIVKKHADVVIASPYMPGGKVIAVPFSRKILSRWANRYISWTSRKKIYTFSGMVRAYKTDFIKNLSLKATTFEVNYEIIYKAQILRAIIVEIPANLNWSEQNKFKGKRESGIKINSGILNGLVSGFIFRPYIFFFIPGIILLLVSFYIIVWIVINTIRIYPHITYAGHYIDDRFSLAVAQVFADKPHAFLIGGFVLVVALLFLGIGFLSLQNKRYFDELFNINTNLLRKLNK